MVILFTASTLDGYIARPDGNLDWLNSRPEPAEGDYGYAALLKSVGSIVMGRRTYEEVLGFGVPWPYEEYRTFIMTRRPDFQPSTPGTFVLPDGIEECLKQEQAGGKDVWLVGGGEVNTEFLNRGLVDRMCITVVPVILGEGIPLFAGKPRETEWTLAEVKGFDTGLVNLVYDRKDFLSMASI